MLPLPVFPTVLLSAASTTSVWATTVAAHHPPLEAWQMVTPEEPILPWITWITPRVSPTPWDSDPPFPVGPWVVPRTVSSSSISSNTGFPTPTSLIITFSTTRETVVVVAPGSSKAARTGKKAWGLCCQTSMSALGISRRIITSKAASATRKITWEFLSPGIKPPMGVMNIMSFRNNSNIFISTSSNSNLADLPI